LSRRLSSAGFFVCLLVLSIRYPRQDAEQERPIASCVGRGSCTWRV